MYPLIYFSIVNIDNWNAYLVVSGLDYFHDISRGVCIGFLVLFAGITIFSVRFETIAKTHKIENAMEYITAIVASGILVGSYSNNYFLFLIVIFVARAVVYVQSRKKYLRDFNKVEYMRYLSLLFEVLTICTILDHSIIAIAPFIILTLLSYSIHSIYVVV